MQIIHSSQIAATVPNWAQQLADLTRIAWTGADGVCYFPYEPLTHAKEWRDHVARDWANGTMHSWVAIHEGRICSHAALVNKGTHWELGRLVAHKAPRGATHEVCKVRLAFCRARGIHARMECTQAHTRAQAHAARVGLRFAGIGFLDQINGINWDIVFFDTMDAPPFDPRPGVLADPLGGLLECRARDRKRLREISHILSTNVGGALPPTRFHVLPELLAPVQQIILLNTIGPRH